MKQVSDIKAVYKQVSRNIFVLVVLIVLSMAMMLGVNSINGYESGKKIEKLITTSQMHSLIIDLEAKSLQMRRIEKDFLLRKDILIAQKYSQTTTNALDTIEAMKLNANYSTISKATINMQKQLQMLYQQFDLVIKQSKEIGLNENSGLNKEMRDSAHTVEKILIDNKLLNFHNVLLNMRRDEKDFLMRKDKMYIEHITAKQLSFIEALKTSTLSDTIKRDASVSLNAYVKSFKALANAELTMAQEVNKLSAIYGVFNTILVEATGFVETMQEKSVESVKEFERQMQGILTAAMIIMLALVSISAVRVLMLMCRFKKQI